MSGLLPVQIDPIRLADEGTRLHGLLSDDGMSRLQELVLPSSLPVQIVVDLKFERSTLGVRRVMGMMRTQIEMACGRCLKPLKVEVVAQMQFVLLLPGETEPEDGEALIVNEPLSLAELVEDELLLAMPMCPGHAEGQCGVESPMHAGNAPVAEKRANPFSEMCGFKSKNL